MERATEVKRTRLTSFAWAYLHVSDCGTLVNRYSSAVSEKVSLKAIDTTLVTFSDAGSPQFLLGWFVEDWTHHGIIFWLNCCCHWRKWGLLMRRTGSWHVDFIVKAIIHFIDSDHIPSIILFINFPRIWIIRIFWVSSAPCSQLIGICQEFSWVTASVNLLS